ncbi:unnamed protein product [Peniophora sp. CBMAI 1063]|nr:unnamed protein product [Peniophora sp. CBMAI 1063]
MLPRDSPYVQSLVEIEELGYIPDVIADLDKYISHDKALPGRTEADVEQISSIMRLSCEQEAILNPKTHFLILMLMVVMRDDEECFFTFGNAELALPRHPRAHLETLADWLPKFCVAAAISLIALDAPEARPKQTMYDSPMISTVLPPEVTPESTSHDPSCSTVETDIDEEPHFTSTSDVTEEDVGLDAHLQQLHLLARPSSSTPFYISAVCLSSYETILDVMASALQQRRAWGLVNTPVLGFAFHPLSTRLGTFWGWFEDQDTDEGLCMPVPRIACSTASRIVQTTSICAQTTQLFGSFDLAERASSLRLAHFLHSLRPHFQALRDAGNKALHAGLAHGEPATWRADVPMIKIDEGTFSDRIRSWLEKTEPPEGRDAVPSLSTFPSPSNSSCSSMSDPTGTRKTKGPKAPSAASSSQKVDSKKASRTVLSQGTGSQVSSALLTVPDFEVGAPSVAGTRVSASTFSHPASAKSFHKVHYWSLSRTVLTHTLTGAQPPPGRTKPWADAVKGYYDISSPVHQMSAGIEKEFAEYRERFKFRSAGDGERVEILRDAIGSDVEGSITDRCILRLAPAILLAVELSKGLALAAEWIGNSAIPEATWRSVWDFLTAVVLLYLSSLDDDANDTVVVDMLEQFVRLPQADRLIQKLSDPSGYSGNTYQELTRETTLVDSQKQKQKQQDRSAPEAERLHIVYLQAQLAAKYHQTAFQTWEGTPRKKTDHAEAPLRSKIDALWALSLDDFFADDSLVYRRENPHFLPLDVAERISRYQVSSAPSSVKSSIHRSAAFMNSSKGTESMSRIHYFMDTMIGGTLGTQLPGLPASERHMQLQAAYHRMLVAEAKSTKKLPCVPLQSVLLLPFFCRMALVAATKFLGTLSVTRRPVYGLVTEGPVGSVHMAVGIRGDAEYSLTNVELRLDGADKNEEELSVHVFERGCNMFNLKTEQGAIAYVAFLVNLYTKVAPQLASELSSAKNHMRQELQRSREEGREPRLSWSMEQNSDVIEYERERQEKHARERKERGESEPAKQELGLEDDTLPGDYGFS